MWQTVSMATSRKIGVAWKRRDKYDRGYIHVQVGEGGKLYRFELFKNTEKTAKHQPDYIAFLLEP